MNNRNNLDRELETRIKDLEKKIRAIEYGFGDATKERDLCESLYKLRQKNKEDGLDTEPKKALNPDGESKYLTEIKGYNFSMRFSSSWGVGGERVLQKYKGKSFDSRQLGLAALKEGFLDPDVCSEDKLLGCMQGQMKRRFKLYQEKGMKCPYSIIKPEYSRSGNFEFVWTCEDDSWVIIDH